MNQIEIYKAPDSKIEINVNLENETVWLTQGQMAILFEKGRATISEHIQNVSKEGELVKKWYVGISDKLKLTGSILEHVDRIIK